MWKFTVLIKDNEGGFYFQINSCAWSLTHILKNTGISSCSILYQLFILHQVSEICDLFIVAHLSDNITIKWLWGTHLHTVPNFSYCISVCFADVFPLSSTCTADSSSQHAREGTGAENGSEHCCFPCQNSSGTVLKLPEKPECLFKE